MKKNIFWILLGLLLSFKTNIFAQEINYGLLGGIDFANARLTNKPKANGDSRIFHPMVSFNVNGYIGYKISRLWGLSAEPGFIQKGGVMLYDKENKDDNKRLQLNYLQLPILVDFYMGEKLFLSVGPEFAYMINAKLKSKDNLQDISKFYENDFEISGVLGINYNIHANFDIGIRYNHGLTYSSILTLRDADGASIGESKEYNQYFQVFVRFKL